MIKAEMYNSLQEAFCSVLENERTMLTSVVQPEKRFGVKFQAAEMEQLKNVARRS